MLRVSVACLAAITTLAGCARTPAAAPATTQQSPPAADSASTRPVTAPPGPGAVPSRLRVSTGTDVLAERLPPVLAGKRVGLVTNHTGLDASGRSTIDILFGRVDMELVALFGPEHGIRGTAAEGERVESGRDERTGLPIHSLYGATHKPTPAMLEGVEALVFDIQDVGARQYTYIYTMARAMQAAAEKGIPFVVLDRPNPVRGDIVAGGILDTAYASGVGLYSIASRHGMTAGELARMFNAEQGFGADLHVVRMRGWRRDLWHDQTGLDWVPPSPNLPRLESAIHYPGTVFFEAINLSEGRGTSHPFEQTGAPWLRAEEVAAEMNAMRLPGVRFEAVSFTPAASAAKYPGVALRGVRLVATDRDVYRPLPTVLRLIDVIRRTHPDEFRWVGGPTQENPDAAYWLDRLAGTDRLRRAYETGSLDAVLAAWDTESREFEARRKEYLLY
ncbi:MAG TPA: DUF1343 domain-containing protein [Gemmatimonadales bacterium]